MARYPGWTGGIPGTHQVPPPVLAGVAGSVLDARCASALLSRLQSMDVPPRARGSLVHLLASLELVLRRPDRGSSAAAADAYACTRARVHAAASSHPSACIPAFGALGCRTAFSGGPPPPLPLCGSVYSRAMSAVRCTATTRAPCSRSRAAIPLRSPRCRYGANMRPRPPMAAVVLWLHRLTRLSSCTRRVTRNINNK